MSEVKICPRCGGINISIPPSALDLQMTFKDYCEDCGMYGNFPIIDVEEIKNFQKSLKK